MTNSINLSPLNDDDTITINTEPLDTGIFDINFGDLDFPYMGGGGAMGAAQPYVGVTGGSGWTGALNITDTYNLSNHADIMVGDTSLRDWMKTVNDRLSILQPNPKLLKKFTALQQAYEHYRTLEALLHGQDQDETPD